MTGNDNVGLDQAELSAAAVIAVRLHVWRYHSINSHKQFSSSNLRKVITKVMTVEKGVNKVFDFLRT